MRKLLTYINHWQGRLAIVILWIFFEALWLVFLGPHFSLESEKYIGQARLLVTGGHLAEARFMFYFSTIAVIAFAIKSGIGLYGAMFLIMLVNLLCYLYFFKALRTLFTASAAPYLVVGFLLSFWPYQSWSVYLYSECLFYSSVLLLLSHLILFRGWSSAYLVQLFLIMAFVILSRPLGILFVIPLVVFLYFHLSRNQKIFFYVMAVLVILLFNSVVQTVFTTTSDWNLQKVMQEGDLICNIPNTSGNNNLKITNNPNQLYQLFYFVTHNFSYFCDLAAKRLLLFFTLRREYYSGFHNAYLLLCLGTVYGLILWRVRQIFSYLPLPVLVFIILVILSFTLAVALQCDDYHNRFFLTLMPFWTVLAVAGFFRFPPKRIGGWSGD
ncbi:MAG: hypothetical protein JWP88_1983 [Flaviaesturariibacter sp.]|nr:hypothetical protein [Flaviaesturariibacter sp.]